MAPREVDDERPQTALYDDRADMSQEGEDPRFRFDLVDAILLMLVASLLSLANGCVRQEPMRFQEERGSVRMVLERSHVLGWPSPIYRWSPHEEAGAWSPKAVAGNVVVAVLIGAGVLFARRGIARFIAFRTNRSSAEER